MHDSVPCLQLHAVLKARQQCMTVCTNMTSLDNPKPLSCTVSVGGVLMNYRMVCNMPAAVSLLGSY